MGWGEEPGVACFIFHLLHMYVPTHSKHIFGAGTFTSAIEDENPSEVYLRIYRNSEPLREKEVARDGGKSGSISTMHIIQNTPLERGRGRTKIHLLIPPPSPSFCYGGGSCLLFQVPLLSINTPYYTTPIHSFAIQQLSFLQHHFAHIESSSSWNITNGTFQANYTHP